MTDTDLSNVTFRVQSGRAAEEMSDQRRAAAIELAADLSSLGYQTETEIVERVPGRYGITPVEWIFISVVVPTGYRIAGVVLDKAVGDAYDAAKKWAKRQGAKREGHGRHLGVSVGMQGKGELRRWHTGQSDDEATNDEE